MMMNHSFALCLVLLLCVGFWFLLQRAVGKSGGFICVGEKERTVEWGERNSIFQWSKFLEEIAKTLGKQQI